MINFSNPASVIQVAPMSGVFGSAAFLEDKQEFVNRVIAKWYCHLANTIPCETYAHLEQAEQLHDFYLTYQEARKATGKNFGRVLHRLYVTGSIKEAEKTLKKCCSTE